MTNNKGSIGIMLLAISGCISGTLTSTQAADPIAAAPATALTTQSLSQKIKEQDLRIFSAVSAAGGEFGKSCAQILTGDNVYDEHRILSGSYRIQQYYNWACDSKFETASDMKNAGVKLSIPLEDLPAPLGLDAVFSSANFKESLHQWCATAWTTLADQAIRQEFSRVIDAGMVSAYKTCIDAEKDTILQQYGVFAYATPQNFNLNDFLVRVEFRAMDFNNPKITTIEGSDVKCTIGGQDVKDYTVTTTSLTMNCKKPSDNSGSIAVNTDKLGTSPFINLPGKTDGLIMEMDQRTQGLAQLILQDRKNVSSRLDTINGRFDKVRFDATACTVVETCAGGEPPCPAGFRDTGFVSTNTWPHGGCGAGSRCRVCYTVDP